MNNMYFYRSIDDIYMIGSLEQCNDAKEKLNRDWYEVLQIIDSEYYKYREKSLENTNVLSELNIRDFYTHSNDEDTPR